MVPIFVRHWCSILEDMYCNLPHLEAKWLKLLWVFLRHIHRSLILEDTYVSSKQQTRDQDIIDLIIDYGKFTGSQIKKSIIV